MLKLVDEAIVDIEVQFEGEYLLSNSESHIGDEVVNPNAKGFGEPNLQHTIEGEGLPTLTIHVEGQ